MENDIESDTDLENNEFSSCQESNGRQWSWNLRQHWL